MKTKILVSIEHNEREISSQDLLAYIRYAIKTMKGSFHPEEYLFNLPEKKITAKLSNN